MKRVFFSGQRLSAWSLKQTKEKKSELWIQIPRFGIYVRNYFVLLLFLYFGPTASKFFRYSNTVFSFPFLLCLLYQPYSCKERIKTWSCKSNKKTSEKFNICINKEETKGSNYCAGEYENVCEIEKKNVRSCIDRNELILGNFTCWIVVESRNRMFQYSCW